MILTGTATSRSWNIRISQIPCGTSYTGQIFSNILNLTHKTRRFCLTENVLQQPPTTAFSIS